MLDKFKTGNMLADKDNSMVFYTILAKAPELDFEGLQYYFVEVWDRGSKWFSSFEENYLDSITEINTYKISYSLFHKSGDYHFSNCHSYVEGKTFEKALEKLEEEKLVHGWIVKFAVEGDLFEIKWEK